MRKVEVQYTPNIESIIEDHVRRGVPLEVTHTHSELGRRQEGYGRVETVCMERVLEPHKEEARFHGEEEEEPTARLQNSPL